MQRAQSGGPDRLPVRGSHTSGVNGSRHSVPPHLSERYSPYSSGPFSRARTSEDSSGHSSPRLHSTEPDALHQTALYFQENFDSMGTTTSPRSPHRRRNSASSDGSLSSDSPRSTDSIPNSPITSPPTQHRNKSKAGDATSGGSTQTALELLHNPGLSSQEPDRNRALRRAQTLPLKIETDPPASSTPEPTEVGNAASPPEQESDITMTVITPKRQPTKKTPHSFTFGQSPHSESFGSLSQTPGTHITSSQETYFSTSSSQDSMRGSDPGSAVSSQGPHSQEPLDEMMVVDTDDDDNPSQDHLDETSTEVVSLAPSSSQDGNELQVRLQQRGAEFRIVVQGKFLTTSPTTYSNTTDNCSLERPPLERECVIGIGSHTFFKLTISEGNQPSPATTGTTIHNGPHAYEGTPYGYRSPSPATVLTT